MLNNKRRTENMKHNQYWHGEYVVPEMSVIHVMGVRGY